MVTIAGNGMGEYSFSNVRLDMSTFEIIICDKNFKETAKNILKLSFKEAKAYIQDNYKLQNILYIVTGSPLFYSSATIIAKHIPKEYIRFINNRSCKSYLLERVFISECDVGVVSLHGKTKIDLEEFLRKRYTFLVCDKHSIKRLNQALGFFKKEDISVTMAYKLGYEDERIEEIDIFDFSYSSFDISKTLLLTYKKKF